MTLEDIVREVRALPLDERKRLIGLVVTIESWKPDGA